MQHPCPRCGKRLAPGRPPGLCPACLGQGSETPDAAALRRVGQNVEVHCLCGWKFFVPRSSAAFVNCPQCRAPVPTTGARLNQGAELADPESAAPAVAAAPAPSRLPLILIAGSGLVVLGAGVLTLALLLRRPPPPPAAVAPPASAPISAPVPAPERPRIPASKAPSGDYVDYTQRIERLAAQCNMAGIAGAILLDSGRSAENAELEDRLRVFDREILDLDRLRAQRGERLALPSYYQAGDRLLALSERVRDPAHPVPFAELLKDWLRGFRAGARETLVVLRGARRISFDAAFPERTKELNLLAQRTGIMLGEGQPIAERPAEIPAAAPPSAPPAPPPAVVASPYAALLVEARAQVQKLHPWYRARALAEENERVRQAAAASDPDALRYRALTECCERFSAEHEAFSRRASELEASLAAAPASADVVHFKDGRKIEGTVEEQTEEKIRIRSRLGAATFPADQVLRVEKGKGAAQTFPARMQAARGKAPELESLLAWCRENNLPAHREVVANALLHLEPGHEAARADAGFTKLASGDWARGDDARLREGKIEWQGRLYAPDQLRAQLRSLGYVQIGASWYEKVPGSFRIDNLYRDENVIGRHLRGGAIRNQVETNRDTVYDIRTKSWVPRTRQVAVARFLGDSHLEFETAGPILECRVKARGQTPRIGDSVSASVQAFVDDPWPRLLYKLSAPGENAQSYDVTDKLLGQNRIVIRGAVSGGGMFLPSDSNDLGVLEIKYAWGRPLAKLNDLLAARPDPPAPDAPPAPAPVALTQETVLASGFADARARSAAVQASARTSLIEALDEMRRAMETHAYYRELAVPSKYQAAVELIQNPLQPRLETASRERLFSLSSWWTGMGPYDRAEFAAFYGVWCARVRAFGK